MASDSTAAESFAADAEEVAKLFSDPHVSDLFNNHIIEIDKKREGKIIGEEGWISLGPWGGGGGVYSTYKSDGPIMQITISCGDVIDYILFESKSRDGVVIGSPVKIGGPGGANGKKFCIDSSVEHLSAISLTYGDYCGYMFIVDSSVEQLSSLILTYGDYYGQVAITSLYFKTNIGNHHGPFGRSGASFVSIPIEGGFITGFHGRRGNGTYLTAIGIFVAPKVNNLPSSEKKIDSLPSFQDPNCAPTQLEVTF
ncbi:hypothetical protein RHGRI_033475 [Rhododendron griersonianum]|uniref:Jacalin-type lectin domain-containing protein n=1 Tax=Rhododendron griersonianum TaxID=479676 RepID=A0AAV6HXW7_9ERIC|nr:hypothetical protein RHGRI_033475 [Rhododendron griersonianum]